MTDAPRILFITWTRIGDAVMSTGVLKALIDRYSTARFTIACGPLAAPLFTAVPRLDRIIVMRKQKFDGHWFALWREVKGIHWHTVVDLRRSLIAYTLRADHRCVLGPDDPRVARVASLPAVIGIDHPLDPFVFTDERHRAAAARLIPDGPPVLAVGPVASLPEKTWAAQRFQELVRLLTAAGGACAGWRVAGFGGPGDGAAVTEVLEAVPPTSRIAIVGEPDLLAVHAALARCGVFVGNDSGLSHLAAAAGVPTVAVFGATQPQRYAPWGGTAIQEPAGNLAALTAKTVADGVHRILAGAGRAGAGN
jgi:ADP-heptose:LPS heptosyltransferase